MKFFITLIAVAVITATAHAGGMPEFIRALHQVETSGRLGAIRGDGGRALGPLQIHHAYWRDAVQYDRSIGGRYQDVVDLAYAAKVVDAYMRRYAAQAYRAGDYVTLARIHNGGPRGHRKTATLRYAEKIRRALR